MSEPKSLRTAYNVDNSTWDTDTENYVIALEADNAQLNAKVNAQREALDKKERKYLTVKGDLLARQIAMKRELDALADRITRLEARA